MCMCCGNDLGVQTFTDLKLIVLLDRDQEKTSSLHGIRDGPFSLACGSSKEKSYFSSSTASPDAEVVFEGAYTMEMTATEVERLDAPDPQPGPGHLKDHRVQTTFRGADK